MWLPINENYDISSEGQVWSKRYLRLLKPYLSHSYYSIRMGNSKSKKYPIHQLVAKAFLPAPTEEGSVIDHIDRNGLNNQRNNLRDSTRSQNNANRGLNKNNTSGYKGVCWNKQKQKWHARIRVNYKYVQLGLFDNIKDAARAYNKAALKYFGEFAWLNPI